MNNVSRDTAGIILKYLSEKEYRSLTLVNKRWNDFVIHYLLLAYACFFAKDSAERRTAWSLCQRRVSTIDYTTWWRKVIAGGNVYALAKILQHRRLAIFTKDDQDLETLTDLSSILNRHKLSQMDIQLAIAVYTRARFRFELRIPDVDGYGPHFEEGLREYFLSCNRTVSISLDWGIADPSERMRDTMVKVVIQVLRAMKSMSENVSHVEFVPNCLYSMLWKLSDMDSSAIAASFMELLKEIKVQKLSFHKTLIWGTSEDLINEQHIRQATARNPVLTDVSCWHTRGPFPFIYIRTEQFVTPDDPKVNPQATRGCCTLL